MKITVTVNGVERSGDVEPRTLLVHFLRDELDLTGTNIGCDTSSCGACTIHVEGQSAKSCTMLAVQADGRSVTTIEGLAAPNGDLHPMQTAFREHHGLQCGFCTPGMVMMGIDIANRMPGADEDTVRHQLEGNICRCTGYQGIVEAIIDGSAKMNAAKA